MWSKKQKKDIINRIFFLGSSVKSSEDFTNVNVRFNIDFYLVEMKHFGVLLLMLLYFYDLYHGVWKCKTHKQLNEIHQHEVFDLSKLYLYKLYLSKVT